MNREMYKKERQMSSEATAAIFSKGNHGTLAVNGDDGYPYAVPVNYVYDGGKIYIHSAKYGYKIDAVKRDDKVCFSAILNSKVQQDKFTAAFQSVIAFGKISFVEDEAEKKKDTGTVHIQDVTGICRGRNEVRQRSHRQDGSPVHRRRGD